MRLELTIDEFGELDFLPIPETEEEKKFFEEVMVVWGETLRLILKSRYESNGPCDPREFLKKHANRAILSLTVTGRERMKEVRNENLF